MMENKKNIRNCIKEKGIKMNYLAKKLGISPEWFSKKIKNPQNFNAKEMYILSTELNVPISKLDFGIKM